MAEPITLAEAKAHLRVDSIDDDDAIERTIKAAREWVEGYTGQTLVRREVSSSFSSFGQMRLRGWPIAPDTVVTIDYLDTDGAAQIISASRLMAGQRPAFLLPVVGGCWPAVYPGGGAVTVTYEAGYATPADVPQAAVAAMLLIITALYDDRESGLTEAVERAAKGLVRHMRLNRV